MPAGGARSPAPPRLRARRRVLVALASTSPSTSLRRRDASPRPSPATALSGRGGLLRVAPRSCSCSTSTDGALDPASPRQTRGPRRPALSSAPRPGAAVHRRLRPPVRRARRWFGFPIGLHAEHGQWSPAGLWSAPVPGTWPERVLEGKFAARTLGSIVEAPASPGTTAWPIDGPAGQRAEGPPLALPNAHRDPRRERWSRSVRTEPTRGAPSPPCAPEDPWASRWRPSDRRERWDLFAAALPAWTFFLRRKRTEPRSAQARVSDDRAFARASPRARWRRPRSASPLTGGATQGPWARRRTTVANGVRRSGHAPALVTQARQASAAAAVSCIAAWRSRGASHRTSAHARAERRAGATSALMNAAANGRDLLAVEARLAQSTISRRTARADPPHAPHAAAQHRAHSSMHACMGWFLAPPPEGPAV